MSKAPETWELPDRRGYLRTESGDGIDNEQPYRTARIGNAKKDIFLACAVIAVPMLLLSGLLLGLILGYRVRQPDTLSSSLHFAQAADSDHSAFYVNFDATRLITVASWTSSVAPILPTFLMTLFSYSTAQRIMRSSADGRVGELPTPYQLSLLLGILGAEIGSLRQYFDYRRWKQRVEVVGTVNRALLLLVIATLMGYAIVGVDTWLHVTTSTVPYSQIAPSPSPEDSFGRGLYSSTCQTAQNQGDTEQPLYIPCNLDGGGQGETLIGSLEAYKTLNNASSTNVVSRFVLDGQTYAYLAGAQVPDSVDFEARTFAMATRCKPISKACGLQVEDGADTNYHCSNAFHGDVVEEITYLGPSILLFEDKNFSTNITGYPKAMNPFYLGTWANLNLASPALQKDPEIVTPEHGGTTYILGCNSTVYDMTYTWINGTFGNATTLTPSNGSMAQIFAAPINEEYAFATPFFDSAAFAAAASSNTSEQLAHLWSTSYSQGALAFSAGVISPRTNLLQQSRTLLLVARIPKAPLFTLIALNLLYTIIGFVLAFSALSSDPLETRDVQARLSMRGLTAACFEGAEAEAPVRKVEAMFVEKSEGGMASQRVGMVRSVLGGWKFAGASVRQGEVMNAL